MEERKRRWSVRLLVLMAVFLISFAVPVSAAGGVVIRSCTINSSTKKEVNVEASQISAVKSDDGQYYLFALMPYENSVGKSSILLAKSRQQAMMNFRVALNKDSKNSVLYRKFAVAVKQNGQYRLASNAMYITNPQVLAKYTYKFPSAASKKGLHIQPDMLTDAEDLSVKHAAVNICLDTFVATAGSKNKSTSYAYSYQGKTYWFTKWACREVDRQVEKLSENNVIISGILLLRSQFGGSVLIAPQARGAGKPYYGFNTMDQEGVETLAALISFLGERYMKSPKTNGRIVNWIVGNEVNDYGTYNYLGKLSFGEYVEAYARSFRVVSTALRSVYSNARVYISLDHLWNMKQYHGQSFYSKNMLDGFAGALAAQGDINWNLAFHPYPAPLTDPVFWDDNVSDSDSTKTVTMKNIGYLTDYVTKHFRSDVRIILSEQGFTSGAGGKTKEKLQAAAFAYAYYLTEFNDKIDSFIMNRHVDHLEETKQNLYLGVWKNTSGKLEYASEKKEIWDVFKYIDSASSKSVTQFALSYIHASSWESLIPGFSWSRFSKMGSYSSGKVTAVKKSSGTKKISNKLKYSYTGSVRKKGNTTIVDINRNANPNLYQGAGWKFSKKLNFKTKNRFVCKIKVTGLKETYAHVRLRFFSGRNVYEASAKVKGNKTALVSANLSKWKYRSSVDKIQIWVRPNKKTKWKKSAKITISDMRQAKSVKK